MNLAFSNIYSIDVDFLHMSFSPDFIANTDLQSLHFDGPAWYSALWALNESLLIISLLHTLHTLASFSSNLADPGQILFLIWFWWRLRLKAFEKDIPQTSQLRVWLALSLSLFLCLISWCLFKLYFDEHWIQQTSQFRIFFLKEVNDKNVSNQKGPFLPWSVLCRSNGRHVSKFFNELQRKWSRSRLASFYSRF